MGTKTVATRLPPLSVQQLGELEIEEKRLCRALSNCVENHSSRYNEQKVIDYLRAFAVEIFTFYHGFYAELPRYQFQWAQIVKTNTSKRIMDCFRRECSAPAGKVTSYKREVDSAIRDHLKELVEIVNDEMLKHIKASRTQVNHVIRPERMSVTITCPSAAQKMQSYINTNALGLTEFAIQANTSDKTIRKFRHTGKIKRSILKGIASAMGVTKEELLKA